MELNEKHIELVGLYLQGRLEGEELSSFLDEIEQNAPLKKEIEIQKAIQEGIEHKNNQELRARFKKIAAEKKGAKKETKVISMPLLKILASAAAVAILCFSAYFLMQPSSDTNAIYARYFDPSELNITRSTDLDDADLVAVKELYNTKKYEVAMPLFKKIVEADPSSSNLRLAYGNALMECKKIKLAREQFTYIINANDPLYTDQSRWYLALLELKEGNLKETKANLDLLISDENSDFYKEAKMLLIELED